MGVKDNGTLAGIQSEEEAYMIDAAARVFCSPPPQVTMKPYAAGGRTILVAEVAEAESKPVKVIGEDGRKTAYIRMADENILASTVHIAMWRQQHNPRGSLMRMCGEEQLLLDLFEQNERVNLETACETAHISRRKAANMIARLVRFGIVETFLSDHELCWRKNREK